MRNLKAAIFLSASEVPTQRTRCIEARINYQLQFPAAEWIYVCGSGRVDLCEQLLRDRLQSRRAKQESWLDVDNPVIEILLQSHCCAGCPQRGDTDHCARAGEIAVGRMEK